MYNLFELDIQDLFRIRDALIILARYDLHNKDLMYEVSKEIQDRERKINGTQE